MNLINKYINENMILDSTNHTFQIGDRVMLKTFEEVSRQYPRNGWSSMFFDRHVGEIFKVIGRDQHDSNSLLCKSQKPGCRDEHSLSKMALVIARRK